MREVSPRSFTGSFVPTKNPKTHRYLNRDGHINVRREGWRHWQMLDWYHWLLRISWLQMSLVVICLYLCINFFFATLYFFDPGGLENAKPWDFQDAFFFSVQTLSTIGYGHVSPSSFYANCIVTVESLVGIGNLGLLSGLIFSRFSRPSARVMFSHYALITPFDGQPTMMFRTANRRGNQILHAKINVSLARNEVTMEGEKLRRFYDLKLLRDYSSFFSLTWTVRHRIDKDSPLFGVTAEELKKSETEIIVLLSGIDDVFGQTVHGRFAYNHEEILFGHRFVDMFGRDEHDRPTINYDKFDEVALVT